MACQFVKELFAGGKLLDGVKNIMDEVITSKEGADPKMGKG
jgi:hypothetical protein